MTLIMMRYLRAMGSAIDIAPSTNYSKFVTSEDDKTNLQDDMIAISQDMTKSISKISTSLYVCK